MFLSYSLHKILSESSCPFSAIEYSRFKFGDSLCAQKFANELFENFISDYGDLILKQKEIIVLPSPYFTIPTASSSLCAAFKENLNRFLFFNNRKSCVESKIHRNQTYVQDYGNMDLEDRLNLISNDTYYIDREFIDNKFCILIDDIKITGSHERTVNNILTKYNVKGQFCFLYYAELLNKEIHPSIENYYNYFALQSLEDLIHIITNPGFKFNTRVIKYILLLEEQDLHKVLLTLNAKQQNDLLNLAIGNNYQLISEYTNSLKLLTNKLWQSTYKRGKEKV